MKKLNYIDLCTIPGTEINPEASEKLETETHPSTGYTTLLGYIGVAITAVGGFLLSKRYKNK